MKLDDLEGLAENDPAMTTPTTEGTEASPDAGAIAEADAFLLELQDLIEEDHVQYARNTLEDIYETVASKGFVTRRQREAVENIDEGGRRFQEGTRRWD